MPEIKLGLSVRPDHNSCIHSYSMSELREGNKQKRMGKNVYMCAYSAYVLKDTALEMDPKQEMNSFFFFFNNVVI